MEFDERKPYAIASVIIKKSVSPEEALQHALNITKKKKLKMTETKNTYRFRNLPKTKFSDYRSKKINKNITLLFGELKPEFARLSGRGFLDYFRKGYDYVKEKVGNVADAVKEKVGNVADAVGNYLSPKLDDYPNFTKKMLTQYGNETITKLTMYRKPIGEYINVVINAVSLGRWNELVKKAGYDKFFHLSLIAEVKGEKLNIEKTDVVSISKDIPEGAGTETQDVPLNGKSFTLNELMQKTRANMGDKAFFEYDGFKNNCQVFVSNLLKSVGLYGATERGFAYQPIKEVIDELPDYVKNFQRGITDFSATLKRITGQGKVPPEEYQKFIAFLQSKGIEKKPSDAQLKRLYREFKGVKRLSGGGFWDDFKRGFNMVFEPASKYILKPLATLTGNVPVAVGLTALGYGKDTPIQGGDWPIYKAPRHPPKLEAGNVWRGLADGIKMGLDSYKKLGEDDKQSVKDTAKDVLKKMAVAGAVGLYEHKLDEDDRRKRGGNAFSATNQVYNDIQGFFNKLAGKGEPSDIPPTEDDIENMQEDFGQNTHPIWTGSGRSDLIISQFHRWLKLNAHRYSDSDLRSLFKKFKNK